MTAFFFPECSDHVGRIKHRSFFSGFFQRNKMSFNTQSPASALHHGIAVNLILSAADINAASKMKPTRLLISVFQFTINLKRVAVHFSRSIGADDGE